jgi:hypothetical protein
MKKILIVLFLIIASGSIAEAHRHGHRHFTITVQTFYDELSPFGDWIYSPDYGYVWRPYFDYPENFRPYSSRGNWVNTEYGWTWVSDYPWGWATFHYGRWYFDDYLGWMWIPGYEWAPAWVSWGSYGDYWGWAPLGPSINVSVNFNWFAPDPWWTFVPRRHFCSHDWYHHIYDRPIHVTNITYINNIYNDRNDVRRSNSWFYGPRVSDVERHTKTHVRQMRVVDNDRPDNLRVDNDQVRVYRPGVDQNRENSRPGQYRDMEQERKGGRMVQQNSRSNDPGNYQKRSVDEKSNTRPGINERKESEIRMPGIEKRSSDKNIEKRNERQNSVEKSKENSPGYRTPRNDEHENRNPGNKAVSEQKEKRNNTHSGTSGVSERSNNTKNATHSENKSKRSVEQKKSKENSRTNSTRSSKSSSGERENSKRK